MKTKFTKAIFAIMLLIAFAQTANAQFVGINNSSPDDPLDVVGSAQITGPLKVGNPTAPPTQTLNYIKLLEINPNSGFAGWDYVNVCGSTGWLLSSSITNKNYMSYTTPASRAVTRAISPWVWVPTGSTSPYISMPFSRTTGDNGYDGFYLEYTTNGSTWNLLTPITTSYVSTAGTSATNCTVAYSGQAWSAAFSNVIAEFIPTASLFAGKWVQFGITAVSDASLNGSVISIYGFGFECSPPSGLLNATFQNGSVYAEKNVYAGSNVLMGDLAEYFRIKDKAEPGMLVSMSINGKDQYELTKTKNDTKVIGIVSSSPTITLNNPNSGTPVAMAGRVPVYVTDENGSISTGDYLTASSTPGYAMKAIGSCFVIGKAVESFTGKVGKITCVVDNGWMNTGSSEEIISGDFYIAKGKNTATIKNPLVNKNSKLSVTPLTAYSNFIVTKNEGSFKMTIDKIATKNMYFDYFAINPSGTKKVLEDKIANVENAKQAKLVPLPQATQQNLQVPPIPADPTKFYKWDGKTVTEFVPSVSSKTNTQ